MRVERGVVGCEAVHHIVLYFPKKYIHQHKVRQMYNNDYFRLRKSENDWRNKNLLLYHSIDVHVNLSQDEEIHSSSDATTMTC